MSDRIRVEKTETTRARQEPRSRPPSKKYPLILTLPDGERAGVSQNHGGSDDMKTMDYSDFDIPRQRLEALTARLHHRDR
jgi:hypothetical protein